MPQFRRQGLLDRLQYLRDRNPVLWPNEEMDVLRHHDVCLNLESQPVPGTPQTIKEDVLALVARQIRLSAVATERQEVRVPFYVVTPPSWPIHWIAFWHGQTDFKAAREVTESGANSVVRDLSINLATRLSRLQQPGHPPAPRTPATVQGRPPTRGWSPI